MCSGTPIPNFPDSLLISFALNHPQWPPRPTILGNLECFQLLDFTRQSEWGVKEWKAYANYLEESGQSLVKDLVKTRNELSIAKRKLKRSKKNIAIRRGTILTGYEEHRKKGPGRPQGSTRGSQYADDAARAIEIKNSLQEAGFKITDIDVAKKVLIEAGYTERLANQNKKQVTRQMTELRKQNGTNRKRITNHK